MPRRYGVRAAGSVAVRGLVVVVLLALVGASAVSDARAHVPHDVIFVGGVLPTVFQRPDRVRDLEGPCPAIEQRWFQLVGDRARHRSRDLQQVAFAPSDKTRMYLAPTPGCIARPIVARVDVDHPGGGISQIAVSGSNPGVVLAAGRSSGLYRTSTVVRAGFRSAGNLGRVTALSFEPGTRACWARAPDGSTCRSTQVPRGR